MRPDLRVFPLAGALLAAGCIPPTPPPAAVAPETLPSLPPLAVEQTAGIARQEPSAVRSRDAAGDAARDPGPPVTLSASNVDVRALLPVLAEAAGVSLVIGPGVTGRVSVNFKDVPARVALDAVLAETGLALAGESSIEAPWGPTVFYAVPFNIDRASAEAIQRRFGVSPQLAQWLVENRP